MSEFIIHVGPHKTGSSYLQNNMARLRPLLESNGICYPLIWGPMAHHRLLERLSAAQPDAVLEEEIGSLRDGPFSRVVISVEGLANLPEPKVLHLKWLLGDSPVKFVFYVRSWADVLVSHWKEELKAGRIVYTLPEYLCWRMVNVKLNTMLNFGPALDLFARVFGRESIRLVSYDRVLGGNMDLFGHFARTFLDVTNVTPEKTERINASPNTIDTEIIRTLSMMAWGLHGTAPPVKYFNALRNRYMQNRAMLEGTSLLEAMNANLSQVPISETSDGLWTLHQALYQRYEYALVKPKGKRFFFLPRRYEAPYVRPDYLRMPKAAEELRDLHAQLAKGVT